MNIDEKLDAILVKLDTLTTPAPSPVDFAPVLTVLDEIKAKIDAVQADLGNPVV